jgi:hypothetical protein
MISDMSEQKTTFYNKESEYWVLNRFYMRINRFL